VGGGCVIGDGAYLGPGVVVSNGLNVGRGADVKIGSVVVSDVQDGESVSGNFAVSHKKNLLLMSKLKSGRI